MKKINNIGLITKEDHHVNYLLSKTTNSNIIDYYKSSNKSTILTEFYCPKNTCKTIKNSLKRIFNLLDMDVDTIILSSNCNYFKFYDPYEEILKDLGFKFRVINISSINMKNIFKIYSEIKIINSNLSILKYLYYYINTLYLMKKLNIIKQLIEENIGLEINKGEYISTNKFFIQEVLKQNSILKIKKCYKKYLNKFKNIKTDKSKIQHKAKVIGDKTYETLSKLADYNIQSVNYDYDIIIYIKKQGCMKNIFYEQKLKNYVEKNNKKLVVIEDIDSFGGIIL